ncbi:MAG: hypothetical protein HY961_13230 [Ignavibacteriae bacterium]|nr:hypothetical protein [Ignavibacteriota bacterium]
MPQLNLTFTTSALVVVLFVLIATAISIYFYRHTIPPISRRRKIVLVALRALALALLLMLLFEPLLRLISSSTQDPALAVLIDNSKSMKIVDKTGDRFARLKSVLSGGTMKSVDAIGDQQFFAFGANTKQLEVSQLDSLAADADATDITSSLRAVADEKTRSNINAALLITDGSYNLGQNPLYEAEQLGIPVFTIGIGDSTEQKDVLISKIVTNDLVYNETEVPVDVTIKSSGYKGEKVEVTLSEGTKELARTTLLLEEGTREYGVRLSYTPEGEGVKKYSVRVSQLPGELTAANNQRSFLAKILKSKLRVTIVAGAPSPDLSIIKQTLKEDRNLDVRSFTQKSGFGFYEGQLTVAVLDSSDCLVLIGFPVSATTDAVMDVIRSSVQRNTIPVLFIGGKFFDERKLSSLASLLPFTSLNPSQSEQLVFIEIAAAQRNHPILATNTDEGVESWKGLPPIFRTQTTYRAKAEATILANTKINTIVLNDPLIAIRNVSKQKSMAVTGYGLWRWRLMAQGTPETGRLLATFLANSVRWLTTREDNRPVKVTPTKDAFTQGEPVEFVGQVYDANADPVENAELKVTAKREGKDYTTTLRPLGNGRYEGVIEGLGEGDYAFAASANLEGQPLGTDAGRFSVGELALEFQDTRMNAQLLRQIAGRTGGKFYTPETFADLANELRNTPAFAPKEIQTAQEFELWHWKYMLAIVVLLFAIEWFIRKRAGML